MKYDLSRYHWRALFYCARIEGYYHDKISELTGVKLSAIRSYANSANSNNARRPKKYDGKDLLDFFYSILEPHIIRVCTKYD